MRTGPRRSIANAQDERILNERRRYKNLPFDNHPIPAAAIRDLSRTIFENEYLPSAFADDVLRENKRSYTQRLASCRMIASLDDTTPTVTGLLAIGKNPQDFLPGAVDYRNPNIADVLKTFGFIQAFGRGIAVARSAMKENGNPPLEFHTSQTAVLCTLRGRS